MKPSELKTIVDLLCEEGCGEIDNYHLDSYQSLCFPKHHCYLTLQNDGKVFSEDELLTGSIHDPEFRKELVKFLLENFK